MLHEAKIAYYAFDVIRFFVPYAACLKLLGNVTSLPLTLYRSRSCVDVLRGEHADVTDFFSFLVTLVDGVRGQA
jgi:hypothetical protein